MLRSGRSKPKLALRGMDRVWIQLNLDHLDTPRIWLAVKHEHRKRIGGQIFVRVEQSRLSAYEHWSELNIIKDKVVK